MMRSVQQQDPYSCAAGVKLIIRRCPVVSKHRDHNLAASLPMAAATSAEAEFVVQQNEFHELKFWEGERNMGPLLACKYIFHLDGNRTVCNSGDQSALCGSGGICR